MEDQELIALKDLRDKLLVKASNLLEKLNKQEGSDQQSVKLKLPDTITNNNNKKEMLPEYDILYKVSQQITGITFENTEREWLHNNIYQYTTTLVTKVLQIYVVLQVKLEGEIEFEIDDITCHFIHIDKCYMLEIGTWVQKITKMKNFSLLTSAISQYNEQNVLRQRLLNKLKIEKYASYEQCTDKNGGIVIHIHSPNNLQKIYLIFHWSLMFLERTWHIEHHFLINPTEAETTFAKNNRNLLEQFCEASLSKQNLIVLWSQLCSAINSYEGNTSSEIDYSEE
ncbi:hypothetical protein WH47_00138 [Habropoda laboriosa]|uniref:Uncharacterized protein n=1 Tax=Habropoda laboriosa TaxID=597456 RepID=A0A0L7R8W3_9HYME|nr:PREDICTED: uncharacterized protein LOC108570610 [Habropoda laboriosa]KOC67268.1 hypothetical protein WH47_00138 [Habropoda laboriosa]